MIIERSMHSQWLSNTYLVAMEPDSPAVLIDAGGPVAPLLKLASQQRLGLSHVLLTHHHYDHVAELDIVIKECPDIEVAIHPKERAFVPSATYELGEQLTIGELSIDLLETPGHTRGGVAFLINGSDLFTGDTLFRHSVGGLRAPGHTTFSDIKHSIMDVLMKLPPSTTIHPGHTASTTVEEEWHNNPFIQIWRGLDPEGTTPCTALGDPATLILRAKDYDGGYKAWVRWSNGADDILPGSKISGIA